MLKVKQQLVLGCFPVFIEEEVMDVIWLLSRTVQRAQWGIHKGCTATVCMDGEVMISVNNA